MDLARKGSVGFTEGEREAKSQLIVAGGISEEGGIGFKKEGKST